MSQDKRPVCRCIAYPFPHHRDNFCRIEEDGNDRDDVREQDNADRARDCQAEANAGKWL